MDSKGSPRPHLVEGGQLGGGEEGLEAMKGGAYLLVPQEEAEVQLTHVTTSIHKGVHVLLEQQVLQDSALGHEAEQVEVAAEELPCNRLAVSCCKYLCTLPTIRRLNSNAQTEVKVRKQDAKQECMEPHHMEAHLHMIAILLPASHLSTYEWSRLVHIHLVALIEQLNCC